MLSSSVRLLVSSRIASSACLSGANGSRHVLPVALVDIVQDAFHRYLLTLLNQFLIARSARDCADAVRKILTGASGG